MSENETPNLPPQPGVPILPASTFNNVNAASPATIQVPLSVTAAADAATSIVEKITDDLIAASPAGVAAAVIDPLVNNVEAKIIDDVATEGYKIVDAFVDVAEHGNFGEKFSHAFSTLASKVKDHTVSIDAKFAGEVGHIKAEVKAWEQDVKDDLGKAKAKAEAVVHPSHYNLHPSGVEAIEIIQHFTFNVGTAVKHLWRAGLKGGTVELLVQDLQKAKQYIDFEIARITKPVDDATSATGK